MIVKIACADCGKEITPFNTYSIIPNEVTVAISTCTCRIVNCEDCEDLEISQKTVAELEKEIDELRKKLP